MSLLTEALRSNGAQAAADEEPIDVAVKPLAVIVISGAEYLADPAIEPWVAPFYAEVQMLLRERGFHVEFDPGHPYTSPDRHAAVWVGHDLGCKRFHRAPSGMVTLQLETQAAYEDFPSRDMRRRNQANYTLSARDIARLQALSVKAV
jgi:hypothetical protein